MKKMVDEIKEKQKIIKEIKESLDDIEYWRKNYIFEDELSFEDVKELDLLIGKTWRKYYNLYKKLS